MNENKKTRYTSKQLAEDLYDLIKVNALSPDDNDEWTKLCYQFESEAKANIHKFIKNKNMEWDDNMIKIGRDIIITVKYNRGE